MPAVPGAIHHGLDLDWLTQAAARDPLRHAYALRDALQAPERTRFVRWDGPAGRRSYLLLWYGRPDAPVVHWVDEEQEGDEALLREIPETATVAIVPERVASSVLRRRRGSVAEPLLALRWEGGRPPGPGPGGPVRRLDEEDHREVREFARRFPDRLTEAYQTLDLRMDTAWGAFDGSRLVGVARTSVRLDRIWIIGGVYVSPEARRKGHGRALMRAAISAAASAGATPALYVRESNAAARALYRSLDFLEVERRVWIDLATAPRPTGSPGRAPPPVPVRPGSPPGVA